MKKDKTHEILLLGGTAMFIIPVTIGAFLIHPILGLFTMGAFGLLIAKCAADVENEQNDSDK